MTNCYSAECIFCDDIRQEVGGKYSCMGIYSGEVVVESFPITLPLFCMVVHISAPIDSVLDKVQIILDVFGDKKTHDIDRELIKEFRENVPVQMARDRTLEREHMSAQFTLSPLPVAASGSVDVRVNVDGSEIQAGRIQFISKAQRLP